MISVLNRLKHMPGIHPFLQESLLHDAVLSRPGIEDDVEITQIFRQKKDYSGRIPVPVHDIPDSAAHGAFYQGG